MGIGNTTSAAAVACALYGGDAVGVGRGTGVDDAGLARKADAVARGIAANPECTIDPLALLSRRAGAVSNYGGAIAAATRALHT